MIPPVVVKAMKSFCERYIVADDPYQYEGLSTDQLVTIWISHTITRPKFESKTLENEIRKRIANDNISRDDKEILTKVLRVR